MKINYPQVINQTKRMDELAERLAHTTEKLRNIEAELAPYWKGVSAEVHTTANEEMAVLVQKTANKLNTEIHRMRDKAVIVKRTDEKNAFIFNRGIL